MDNCHFMFLGDHPFSSYTPKGGGWPSQYVRSILKIPIFRCEGRTRGGGVPITPR